MATKIEEAIIRVDERLNTITVGMNKLLECIEGNGKPGLKVDVRTLQVDMQTVKDEHKEQRDFRKEIILLAIGEVVTVAGTVAVLLFKK